MYSKVYKISCDAGQAEALMAQYDSTIVDAVRQSPNHVGHQMIEVSADNWVLISNYHSKQGAEDSLQMVQDLVAPMAANTGMTLEVVAEGETVRQIS